MLTKQKDTDYVIACEVRAFGSLLYQQFSQLVNSSRTGNETWQQRTNYQLIRLSSWNHLCFFIACFLSCSGLNFSISKDEPVKNTNISNSWQIFSQIQSKHWKFQKMNFIKNKLFVIKMHKLKNAINSSNLSSELVRIDSVEDAVAKMLADMIPWCSVEERVLRAPS